MLHKMISIDKASGIHNNATLYTRLEKLHNQLKEKGVILPEGVFDFDDDFTVDNCGDVIPCHLSAIELLVNSDLSSENLQAALDCHFPYSTITTSKFVVQPDGTHKKQPIQKRYEVKIPEPLETHKMRDFFEDDVPEEMYKVATIRLQLFNQMTREGYSRAHMFSLIRSSEGVVYYGSYLAEQKGDIEYEPVLKLLNSSKGEAFKDHRVSCIKALIERLGPIQPGKEIVRLSEIDNMWTDAFFNESKMKPASYKGDLMVYPTISWHNDVVKKDVLDAFVSASAAANSRKS